MNKAFRQAQLQKIVRDRDVFTQEELAAALAGKGIETTQVTLSRDIRELGIVKTPEGYREPGAIAAHDNGRENLGHVLQEFLRDVEVAQNLVVLKTNPGSAAAVALALDAEAWPEVVGTVAGDDTIFAATRGPSAAKTLKKKLLGAWR
jgi:transcriptional regulator of arginine metabolism